MNGYGNEGQSGGRIEREYALGRGVVDLLVCFAGEWHVVESKLRRDTQTGTEALERLLGYVVFDLRKKVPWLEKLTQDQVEVEGCRICVIGC